MGGGGGGVVGSVLLRPKVHDKTPVQLKSMVKQMLCVTVCRRLLHSTSVSHHGITLLLSRHARVILEDVQNRVRAKM